MKSMNHWKSVRTIAGIAVAALALSACGGGVGENAGAEGGGGEGYEFGASEEEIKAAFADVEPMTISYQPSAQSPGGAEAYRAEAFVENLETLSDGKITVDVTYGQGIASYAELPDALADGRVDIAYMLPIYLPDQFPVFQAWVSGTTLTGTSPLVDELAANAAIGELAWQDESLISEFRDQGIEPLNIINTAGAVLPMCAQETTTADDWRGKQVRASSTAHTSQLDVLDASPVSMAYTETFEGLQRNTVDCTLSATLAADAGGFLEVAPHVSYPSEVTFARGPGGVYAGVAWNSWPLVVKQLIFDSMQDEFTQSRRGDLAGNYVAAEAVRKYDGSFVEMDEGLESSLLEVSQGLVEAEVEAGRLPEGSVEAIPEALNRWRDVAVELGYEDAGTFANYDEWYDIDDAEYLDPYGERYFEEVMLPHRPN